MKEDEEAQFTPEYYEFIRETFDERTNMEGFLDYVRERIMVSDSLYQELQNYWPDNLVKALLSFDELNDQLAGVTWLTISWVFQTRIVDIIRDAHTTPTHMEDDEDEDAIYDNLWLYYALEKTLEEWILPITFSGELIVKLWDGNILENGGMWHMVTILWGDGEIFEVDSFWNRTDPWSKIEDMSVWEILDTREKVIERIKLLERVIEYHYNDDLEIPEDVWIFYSNAGQKYEAWYASWKDIPTGDMAHIHFWQHLIDMKNDLTQALKKMSVSDTTQVEQWKKDWLKAGISKNLPEEVQENIPPIRGKKLRIIK